MEARIVEIDIRDRARHLGGDMRWHLIRAPGPGRARLAIIAGIAGLAPLAVQAPARAEGDEHALVQAMVDQAGRADAPDAHVPNGGHLAVTTELLDRARKELDRATRLRGTFDEKRARAADGAAREWAETARDLLRAVEAEGHAGEVRGKALDKQAQVERTRALVDEDIARIGRLKAELEAADKSARKDDDPDRRAVEVHEGEEPPKKKPRKGAAPVPPAPPGKTPATGASSASPGPGSPP
jgi:hypothetical protein